MNANEQLFQHAAAQRGPREIRALHGSQLHCRNWLIEAAYRMIQNNLDPEVAERPQDPVVYGGIGAPRATGSASTPSDTLRRPARTSRCWCSRASRSACSRPMPTRARADRQFQPVPHWATWDKFNELDRAGLMMYGQMTAGSWIYIGSQGIVQGTYETFVEAGRQHFGGDLSGSGS